MPDDIAVVSFDGTAEADWTLGNAKAWKAPGGTGAAYLVVQKNLGADSLLPWIRSALEERHPGQFSASRHATEKGFRILLVERA